MNRKERKLFTFLIGFFAVLFAVNIASLIDSDNWSTKEVEVNEVKEEKEVIGTHKNDKYGFKIWTDAETGCEYIVKETYDSAAITPRMENSTKIKGC